MKKHIILIKLYILIKSRIMKDKDNLRQETTISIFVSWWYPPIHAHQEEKVFKSQIRTYRDASFKQALNVFLLKKYNNDE